MKRNDKTWNGRSDGRRSRIALALSGGSAVGIAHIGAVRAIREADMDIVAVSGTSAGSVVAACVAFGVPEERMIEVSRRLSWSNISDFGYSKLGLNSNRPVGALVEELIGDVRIEDARIPLSVVATDIDTGEKIVFRKGSLAEAIRASTCIPGFFVPVEIGGRRLVDGGIVENLPIPSLPRSKADLRVGIDLGYWRTIHPAKNVLDVVTNSYAILVRGQADPTRAGSDRSLVIRPHLEGFTISDFKRMDELIDAGYRATRDRIPSMRRRAEAARLNPMRIIRSAISFLRKRTGL
ncbi:MAG: patatin-like phospholipase family protein [Candidatus Moranbacteria bacterium]|nr:patatin-like phospholipase family protein [Candidatus Moranbacteria bacterium]